MSLEHPFLTQEGWHPQGRRILTAAGEYAYVVDTGGSGVPVVLLHGIMVSSWSWRHVIEALPPDHRTIAICLRGFGWSDKPVGPYNVTILSRFILSVLDSLGIDRCHLVGNSLGGSIAMRIAIDHPERVSTLILAAPAAVELKHVAWLLQVQHHRFAPVYQVFGTRRTYRRFLQIMAYGGRTVSEETMDFFMAPLSCGRTVRAAAMVSRTLAYDAQHLLYNAPRIRQPTLLCWGNRDLLLPLRFSNQLRARLGNAAFKLYRGVGHCPMEECPDEFISDIRDHLQTHGGS
ncbi:MAG: alpha/beta hydrolase [Myxococcota bacterium]|nr:alpha/beta hydrolase [Myxococcota bacterium]